LTHVSEISILGKWTTSSYSVSGDNLNPTLIIHQA